MSAVISELLTYLFKAVVMIICAIAGVLLGKVLRKKKDIKLAAETSDNE